MSAYVYSFDAKDRRVLAGLTFEETAELEALESQIPTSASGQRWLELYNKHVRSCAQMKSAKQLELI